MLMQIDSSRRSWFLTTFACIAALLGFSSVASATDYPQSASELCQKVITIGGAKIRYCRNRALSSYNTNVTRAVIVIPGSGSPSREYYENRIIPNAPAGVLDYTTIVVPQFLEDDGSGNTVTENLGLSAEYLYWSGGWRQCNSAKNQNNLSSCEVLDRIVDALIDNNPNLEHIVVAGHSAGGQLVNRYVAASPAEDDANNRGVTMSYLVSAAGSFAYLSSERPNSTSGCSSDYNDWKYGLNNRNNYANNYSQSTMRERLMFRDVYYIVGSEDLDPYTSCRVKAQGDNHVDGMLEYQKHVFNHCASIYNPWSCYVGIYFRFSVIEGVGHNGNLLLNSDVGHDVMYFLP